MMVLQSGSAANPVRQIILWLTELVRMVAANWGTVSTALAALFVVLVLWITAQRLFGNDADPNFSYTKQSDAGSTTILLSGVHYVIALVTVIALLLWPAPIERPLILVVLGGLVVGHYIVEKRERGEL